MHTAYNLSGSSFFVCYDRRPTWGLLNTNNLYCFEVSLGNTLFWDHVSFLSKFTKEAPKLLAHTSVWALLRLLGIWDPQEQMLSEVLSYVLPHLKISSFSSLSEDFTTSLLCRATSFSEQKDIYCRACIIFSLLLYQITTNVVAWITVVLQIQKSKMG